MHINTIGWLFDDPAHAAEKLSALPPEEREAMLAIQRERALDCYLPAFARAQALQVLRLARDGKSRAVFYSLLGRDDLLPGLQVEAIQGLAALFDRSAKTVGRLYEILQSPFAHPQVRSAAAVALHSFGVKV